MMKKLFALTVCGSLLMAGCFLNDPEAPPPHSFGADDADSLFAELVTRVQSFSQAESYSDVVAKQFTDLRDGFDDIIQQDPANQKANVGYIVSSVLSLNTSTKIRTMADSLDAYFQALDTDENGAVLGKAFRKQGIIGLSKGLGAKTAALAMAQTKKPAFPTFITMSYIQSILESELLPVLDDVVEATQRLENCSETSIPVIIADEGEADTFEIDKGEIYVLDGFVHYLRAYSNWLCAYHFDLYAPNTTNYSWIDSLAHSGSSYGATSYRISGDSLYHCSMYGVDSVETMMLRTLKYNLGRTDFLTLRAKNHAQVKQNLQAVPTLLKTGIASIRAETDDQSDDIIKLDDILDLDEELVDIPAELIEEGVSTSLANKFQSPETLLDFVTELLSGPVAFDETIDSVHIQLTVNVSAFFDNPVQDLRTLLPKYRWVPETEWISGGTEDYRYVNGPYESSSFTVWDYENATINIPATMIASASQTEYGDMEYTLKQPYNYTVNIDSSWSVDPLRLVDDSNKDLDIEALLDANSFFPYFNDYTFNGVFPGMTRQKWLSLFYQNGKSVLK
jgi:hypothetical protein